MECDPEVTEYFLKLTANPDYISDDRMEMIDKKVVHLHARTSELSRVNKARQQLFFQRSHSFKKVPLTKAVVM